jgi:hypothetical protein
LFDVVSVVSSLEVRERLGGGGELRGVLHRRHLRAALGFHHALVPRQLIARLV